ncbi:hypothetical protein CRE_12265, partial [Caenorhabditis remanei]
LKSQLILLYKFICGAAYLPNIQSYVRLSNSARRPMTLICVRPDIKEFFSNSIPLWNSVTCNTHKFLSPGEFVSLLNHSINRL